MRVERNLERSDGVWITDAGETPDSEIRQISTTSLYDDNDALIAQTNPFVEKISKAMALEVTGDTLEIGVGLGALSKEISKRGITHDVADIESALLRGAKGDKFEGDYREALKSKSSKSYDTIVIDVGDGADIWKDAQGREECIRLLKPKGKLLSFSGACYRAKEDVPFLPGFVIKKYIEVKYDMTDPAYPPDPANFLITYIPLYEKL